MDEDWKNYLNQLKIGKLPEEDALDLLKHCGITEEDIQKVLIESSEGVPYYLELSIDTYRRIKKKKQPASEDLQRFRTEFSAGLSNILTGKKKRR